ncbi:MAG TPA: alanine dehydrogenase [Bacteroidetes bacterium]|nr:alanine dehydrogenase [Bacteroidota bacterium]
MKIGIIREGKNPPDSRVPLTPGQCAWIKKKYPLELVVQPYPGRCFKDGEYSAAGIALSEDLSGCDILMGVKEVPTGQLMNGKTYFFFSHTIKAQAYNRGLLKAVLEKKIRLIDYEVLTNDKGQRLIAFGKFAGMVGAHNALWTYGKRTGTLDMPRMNSFKDYEAATGFYEKTTMPRVKIVLTGTGRVAMGASKVLSDMGIALVGPNDFLNKDFDQAVFTRLGCKDYAARKDGSGFEKNDFYQNPQLYKSIFKPYTQVADIMINGIFWDNRAPAFFTINEMASEGFKIKTIADVTCDIAPMASIPSTLRASTIADPVFGFDPTTGEEIAAFSENGIDVMSIDNLPNELPRDASTSFGQQFTEHILPELLKEKSELLERATLAADGKLGKHFTYLEDYVGMANAAS